jgi:hypothetical protein
MKSLENSKTVWFNIIVLIVAMLALPEFISVIPGSWIPFTVLIGGFGNLILRIFYTSESIK